MRPVFPEHEWKYKLSFAEYAVISEKSPDFFPNAGLYV